MAEKRKQSSRYPGRPPQPHVCKDCGTKFTRRPDLDRHITPKVKCPKDACKKLYRTDKKKEFLNHIEKKHPELDYEACKKNFQDQKDRVGPQPGLCIGKGAVESTAQPYHIDPSQYMQSALENLDINDVDIGRYHRTWDNDYGGVTVQHRLNTSSALQARLEYDAFMNAMPLANYRALPSYYDYGYDPSWTYSRFTQAYQLGPSSSYVGTIYTPSPYS